MLVHHQSKYNGSKAAADETFPGLFRWEFDERSTAEEEAKHVRHNVIADNHWNGYDEPKYGAWRVIEFKTKSCKE